MVHLMLQLAVHRLHRSQQSSEAAFAFCCSLVIVLHLILPVWQLLGGRRWSSASFGVGYDMIDILL